MEDWQEAELRRIHEHDRALDQALMCAIRAVAMIFPHLPFDVSLEEAPLTEELTIAVQDKETGEERRERITARLTANPLILDGSTSLAALQAAIALVRAYVERQPPDDEDEDEEWDEDFERPGRS